MTGRMGPRPRSWRLGITAVVLAIVLCLPFALWGEAFLRDFSGEAAVAWIRGWGAWGWLAVIGLLVADLALPVPATPVMSAAGYVWGAALGGLVGAVGSFCAGMAGYGLSRAFGRSVARALVGDHELAGRESWFRRGGPWLVVASRWFPLLPEVVSCLAGLTRMPLRVFAGALACGSLPQGLVYAAIGAAGREAPWLAVGLSVAVPVVLWLGLGPLLARGREEPA